MVGVNPKFFKQNPRNFFSIKETTVPNINRYLTREENFTYNRMPPGIGPKENLKKQVEIYKKKLQDSIKEQFIFLDKNQSYKLSTYTEVVSDILSKVMLRVLAKTHIRFYFDVELMQNVMVNVMTSKSFPFGENQFNHLLSFNQRYKLKKLQEIPYSPEILEHELFYIWKSNLGCSVFELLQNEDSINRHVEIITSFLLQYMKIELSINSPDLYYSFLRIFVFLSKGKNFLTRFKK